METVFKIIPRDVKIENRVILQSFSFDFQTPICLLGESGSGKTLFLKSLKENKNYETNGKVSFYLGSSIKIENWRQELDFAKLEKKEQDFCIHFFKNKENMNEKCGLLKRVFEFPDYLFCDDLNIRNSDMKLLLDYLKSKNILLFYVTHDIEVTPYFSYLIVIKNNQIAVEGKTELVLKEEKLMKLLGFSLPFYVNMSIQLGYYGLMDKIALNKEEMEALLWKSKN